MVDAAAAVAAVGVPDDVLAGAVRDGVPTGRDTKSLAEMTQGASKVPLITRSLAWLSTWFADMQHVVSRC